jgi:hypothetical protein
MQTGVHLTLTACKVSFRDEIFLLGKKCDELDPIRCSRLRLPNPAEVIRKKWCELVNSALEFHGYEVRVDHLSNQARGIDSIPAHHLGSAAMAFERRTGCASEKRKWDERLRKEIIEGKKKRILEAENGLYIQKIENDIRLANIEIKMLTEELLNQQQFEHVSAIRTVPPLVSQTEAIKPANPIADHRPFLSSLSCESIELDFPRTHVGVEAEVEVQEEVEEENEEVFYMRER